MTKQGIYKYALIPASLTALIALSQAGYAEETASRISWSELTQKLEQQGYRIHDIETKYNGWEAEVTDKDNQRYEIRLDHSGRIIRKKIED